MVGGETRQENDSKLQIGDCRVEPSVLQIQLDGEAIRLEPKVMALLVFLAERSPRVVSRGEIFEQVWGGKSVGDETLTRCVSLLRQALGDDARSPRYIETIPRRGYRLVAPVTRTSDSEEGAADRPVATPVPKERSEQGRWKAFGAVGLALWVAGTAWWLGDRRDSGPPSAAVSPRLAVLPFENLGGDPKDQFLADGMTEELTHQLARLSGLRVVSRRSVTQQGMADQETREIARRLRADYLVEGSVLAVGDRLRITAQLIVPERDSHLWSRAYDREIADVLGLHRVVASDIAEQVQTRLTQPELEHLRRSRPVDATAYRSYLRGRQQLNRRTPEDIRGALLSLQRAVDLDDDFAEAWAALADAHLLSDTYLKEPQAYAYARARDAIDRALAIDSSLSSAYASLGLLKLFRDWDWAGSEAAYRRAVELEPSYAQAHQWYSEMLSLAGRHDEALAEVRLAVDLDLLSPLVHAARGQRLNAAGRHLEALDSFRQAEDLGATFDWHLREVAYAYQRLGSEDQAMETFLELARRRGVSGSELVGLTTAAEAEGLRGYWRWQLARLQAPTAGEPMLIAEALAALGDRDAALPWLQMASRRRGGWFLHLMKSPAFDALRADPRFQSLVESTKAPPVTPSNPG